MKRVLVAASLALMLALAVGVAAQETIDPAGTPNFAEIFLEAGFPLDPYLLRVESSGTVDASTVREGCVGVIPSTPDAVLNWSGSTDLLSFFVYSDVDPTLVVVTPSGDILCNDDYSLDTLNPVVSVANPADGPYAIYVGAFDPDAQAYGWLVITQLLTDGIEELVQADLSPMLEVRPPAVSADAVQRSVAELLATADPIFGAADLAAGFGTQEASVTGAGVEPAVSFAINNETCSGFINLIPSYRFTLAEAAPSLSVFFNGGGDATLILRQPDGTFVCNGDASADNLNPALMLENAAPGAYNVWVGSRSPSEVALGTLVISEDAAAQPDVLPAGQ